jgi:hypothetical protein
LTALVIVIYGGYQLIAHWSSRSSAPSPTPAAAAITAPLPSANFDALYHLKNKPSPELAEQAGR